MCQIAGNTICCDWSLRSVFADITWEKPNISQVAINWVSGPRLKLWYALNSKFDGCSDHRFCLYMQFVFIQNKKTICSRFSHPLSGLKFIFNDFLAFKFCWYMIEPTFIEVCLFRFQIYQKIEFRNFRFAEQTYHSRKL